MTDAPERIVEGIEALDHEAGGSWRGDVAAIVRYEQCASGVADRIDRQYREWAKDGTLASVELAGARRHAIAEAIRRGRDYD